MSNLNNERASDADIQQIIDSTEKGTTMFVASWAFYLMAKELKAARTTLTHLSYTWNGGEQWKPPLGLPPSYISNDRAELQEYRKATPTHEATDFQVSDAIAHMESESDMVLAPRGLLGAASGAIRHPKHEAGVTLGALRHYSHQKPITPQPAPPLQAVTVPDEQTWEELCIENPEMTMGDAIIRAASWNACRAAMLAPPQQ